MAQSLKDQTTEIAALAEVLAIPDAIRELSDKFPNQVTLSSSFSYEDQVITDLIFKNTLPVKIFTLDTGRLFLKIRSVITWSS